MRKNGLTEILTKKFTKLVIGQPCSLDLMSPEASPNFLTVNWNKRVAKFLLKSNTGLDTPRQRYNQLIKTAHEIASVNPRGLADLVNAIIRPMQSEALLAVAERGQDAQADIDIRYLFGEKFSRRCFANGYSRGIEISPKPFRLRLGKHAVLPWPWHVERYVSAMATIGFDKIDHADLWRTNHSGKWRQDDINHRVELWLPWGIGIVNGGNHSIMAGIIAAEGELTPSAVYDFSCLLDDIDTDGMVWIDKKSGQPFDQVRDYRMAAVFQIGNLMKKTGFHAFWQEQRSLSPDIYQS